MVQEQSNAGRPRGHYNGKGPVDIPIAKDVHQAIEWALAAVPNASFSLQRQIIKETREQFVDTSANQKRG